MCPITKFDRVLSPHLIEFAVGVSHMFDLYSNQ